MNTFEARYAAAEEPPWEINRPQSEIVALARAGALSGHILDVGCGTGENALYLAGQGHQVVGFDSAPTALAKARAKAAQRGLTVEFVEGDALALEALDSRFDTVIDSGLFHTFSDEQRPRFAAGLRAVVKPGGAYHLVCFSELEPPGWGPRRVTREELRATFATAEGWRVKEIVPATFGTNERDEPIQAWRAWLVRV